MSLVREIERWERIRGGVEEGRRKMRDDMRKNGVEGGNYFFKGLFLSFHLLKGGGMWRVRINNKLKLKRDRNWNWKHEHHNKYQTTTRSINGASNLASSMSMGKLWRERGR